MVTLSVAPGSTMKRKHVSSGHDGNHLEGDGDESAAKKVRACPDICDDVLLGIFSRLTSRDASRCAVLSRHHRHLIGGMDFWLLHRRLSPPLPRPHLAYMATIGASDPTNARRRPAPAAQPLPDRVLPADYMFVDFHLAGAGGDNDELMRYSLIDRVHLYHKYVGTCDGVILMAPESFNGGGGGSASILLFINPAIAGGEVEVEMELPSLRGRGRYRVAGFGYGPSRRAHKLLLIREERYCFPTGEPTQSRAICYRAKELLVYTLGDMPAATDANQQQQRLRSVLSELDATINGSSVFLDGKIYLLADHSRVLAFDVDGESVTAIELPAGAKHAPSSKLMEVSGRLCVAAGGVAELAMWLLAADRREWVRLCKFWCGGGAAAAAGKLAGAWNCGGVLLLYFRYNRSSKTAYLHLYDTRTEKESKLVVPRAVAAESSGLVLCSGYRPTLVPPGSIVGGGAEPRQRGVLAALQPLIERDVKAGRDRTLEAVCFMNLLLYIASKLPGNAEDVIKQIKRRMLPFSQR